MKLVREFLNETFARDNEDKLSSLDIGKTKAIQKWIEDNATFFNDANYHLNSDNSITVDNALSLTPTKYMHNGYYVKKIPIIFPSYIKIKFKDAIDGILVGAIESNKDLVDMALENYDENANIPNNMKDIVKLFQSLGLINITKDIQYKHNVLSFLDYELLKPFTIYCKINTVGDKTYGTIIRGYTIYAGKLSPFITAKFEDENGWITAYEYLKKYLVKWKRISKL